MPPWQKRSGAVIVAGSNPNLNFTTTKYPTEYRLELFHPPYMSMTRPTVSGIIELARRCPELAILQICELDVSTAPKEDAAVLCLGHGLRSMAVRNVLQPCAPQKYLETATLLDRAFPAIDLDDSQQHWVGFGKGWEEILDSVKTIRLRRETGGEYPELPSASTAQTTRHGII